MQPDSQSPAISITGLTKSYGRTAALTGVNLEVRRGEIFGFLGPNGAGKTTTIRCLLDLIRPSAGTIRVLGLDPQADSLMVRAKTGYLPGDLRLDGQSTVETVLRDLNALRASRASPARITQLARRLDLDLKTRVNNLSKGNKQKVGVVQALMHAPDLLLLDEPTSGLDPLIQQVVMALLAEAQAAGATVFFSSHVLSEVQAAASRVAIIRQGRVVEVADTAELASRALRRAQVRFRQPIDPSGLAGVPGLTILNNDGNISFSLQSAGEMDGLIKALAQWPVADFETERPSLEEAFMAHYAGDTASTSAQPKAV
ncbi:MAG: ABC transporter ATP-binding protein [Anaerolineales bacterium]